MRKRPRSPGALGAVLSPVGEWEVTAFLSGSAVASSLPGTSITATVTEDGKLSGSGADGTYAATFARPRP